VADGGGLEMNAVDAAHSRASASSTALTWQDIGSGGVRSAWGSTVLYGHRRWFADQTRTRIRPRTGGQRVRPSSICGSATTFRLAVDEYCQARESCRCWPAAFGHPAASHRSRPIGLFNPVPLATALARRPLATALTPTCQPANGLGNVVQEGLRNEVFENG
jgi:hypothetical protein